MPRIRNLYPGLTLAGKVRVEGEEFDISDTQDSSASTSSDQIALEFARGERLVKGQRGAEMADARSTFVMPEAPWKREGAVAAEGKESEGPADESEGAAADAPVPAQEPESETLPHPEPETPLGPVAGDNGAAPSTRSKPRRK